MYETKIILVHSKCKIAFGFEITIKIAIKKDKELIPKIKQRRLGAVALHVECRKD